MIATKRKCTASLAKALTEPETQALITRYARYWGPRTGVSPEDFAQEICKHIITLNKCVVAFGAKRALDTLGRKNVRADRAGGGVVSLDDPLSVDCDMTLGDTVGDNASPEQIMIENETHAQRSRMARFALNMLLDMTANELDTLLNVVDDLGAEAINWRGKLNVSAIAHAMGRQAGGDLLPIIKQASAMASL